MSVFNQGGFKGESNALTSSMYVHSADTGEPVPSNALLTESGIPILTESELYLLADGY